MNTILKGNKTAEVEVSPMAFDIGERMEKAAKAFGTAKSELLGGTIAVIAKAKQDYEGGPFAVLFKLTASLTEAEADALPEPGQESGNNPAIYKVKVIGDKGKTRSAEHNYYNIVSDTLACNVAKSERINLLEISLGDPAKVNMASVPQDIKDMEVNYRHAEIARLKGELATSRKCVNDAFDLMFQIRVINSLPGVTASPLFAVSPDGQLQDGEDDRPAVVENTKTPMIVTTTVEGRKSIDVSRMSVASFKKLNAAKARENGGTYAALLKTVERGTKTPGGTDTGGNKPDLIATADKFQARVTDLHSYMDKVWSDKDKAAYNDLLKTLGPRGPAGSDDFALSMFQVFTMLGDLYRHDPIRARAEKLNETNILTPKAA